jgi:uncharacterized protein HemY
VRQIIYFLVVLGLAVVIGLFLAHVPAFVLLEVGRFSVAVPLWLLLIFLFILAVVLMLLRRIVRRVLIVPQKLKNNLEILRQRQKMRKKIDAIEAGIKRVAKAQP